VATYCGKCGAEVPPNQQSCGSCGAPVAGGAAYAPVQPVPMQPLAAPAKTGPSALKIVLIVVAVVVGLGILGVGTFSYVIYRAVHKMHVTTSGSGENAKMTMNLPGGTISTGTAETFSASDLGTDIYPGAVAGKGGARMTLPTGSWVTAIYVTPDSKDQVVSFYKSRLGSEVSVYESADSAVISVQKGKQESIIVTVTANKAEYNGKTQIAIVHTVSNKAQ